MFVWPLHYAEVQYLVYVVVNAHSSDCVRKIATSGALFRASLRVERVIVFGNEEDCSVPGTDIRQRIHHIRIRSERVLHFKVIYSPAQPMCWEVAVEIGNVRFVMLRWHENRPSFILKHIRHSALNHIASMHAQITLSNSFLHDTKQRARRGLQQAPCQDANTVHSGWKGWLRWHKMQHAASRAGCCRDAPTVPMPFVGAAPYNIGDFSGHPSGATGFSFTVNAANASLLHHGGRP